MLLNVDIQIIISNESVRRIVVHWKWDENDENVQDFIFV